MFCEVSIDDLIDADGELIDSFPVREFLAMFGTFYARDVTKNNLPHVLVEGPKDAAILEIGYGEETNLTGVRYMLISVGIREAKPKTKKRKAKAKAKRTSKPTITAKKEAA